MAEPGDGTFTAVVSIHGAPRSGTSWLGQIFNSHPAVAYRFQPLFSYAFKDAINPASNDEEIWDFLRALYETHDDFVLQRGAGRLGPTPDFALKDAHPSHLVMKMVRHHGIIARLMGAVPESQVVGLVRHPCAVVNSFLRSSREWDERWSWAEEWRWAPAKNQGRPSEFFGFEAWRRLSGAFLEFERTEPRRFRLIRYEDLVARPRRTVHDLFSWVGLSDHAQTDGFLASSQRGDIRHDYGVAKDAKVVWRWREELEPQISEAILDEVAGTELARFLGD